MTEVDTQPKFGFHFGAENEMKKMSLHHKKLSSPASLESTWRERLWNNLHKEEESESRSADGRLEGSESSEIEENNLGNDVLNLLRKGVRLADVKKVVHELLGEPIVIIRPGSVEDMEERERLEREQSDGKLVPRTETETNQSLLNLGTSGSEKVSSGQEEKVVTDTMTVKSSESQSRYISSTVEFLRRYLPSFAFPRKSRVLGNKKNKIHTHRRTSATRKRHHLGVSSLLSTYLHIST